MVNHGNPNFLIDFGQHCPIVPFYVINYEVWDHLHLNWGCLILISKRLPLGPQHLVGTLNLLTWGFVIITKKSFVIGKYCCIITPTLKSEAAKLSTIHGVLLCSQFSAVLSKSPLLLLICPPHCCYFLVPPTVPTQVGKPIAGSPDGRIVKSLIKLQNVWVVDVIEENANNDCYITPITFLGRLSGAPRQHFFILDPRKMMYGTLTQA